MTSQKVAPFAMALLLCISWSVIAAAATIDQKTDINDFTSANATTTVKASPAEDISAGFHINTLGTASPSLQGLGQETLALPLPGGLVLMGTLLAGLGVMHRRRARA
ncbi:MAG: hypothetical protein AB8B62_02125 [Roseobacter sp.]